MLIDDPLKDIGNWAHRGKAIVGRERISATRRGSSPTTGQHILYKNIRKWLYLVGVGQPFLGNRRPFSGIAWSLMNGRLGELVELVYGGSHPLSIRSNPKWVFQK